MTDDVRSYIKSCQKCQISDPLKPAKKPDLHPIKVLKPFELVGIDLVGPLKETEDGNKYIFTATDYYTKWVEAYPIPTKSASDVSKCIKKLFARHGAMNAILTDQGREFLNEVNENLCQTWNVKHKVTAAYHPQTNGLDERTNQTVKSALRKMTNECQTDWDQHLDGVLFSIRTKPHSSTKYSPFFLLYGREAVYPSQLPENFFSERLPDEPSANRIEADVNARQGQKQNVLEKVKDNIEKAQGKQKKDYVKRNSKHYEEVKVDDKVLLFDTAKASRKSRGNLKPNYLGPYTVIDIVGKQAILKTASGITLRKKCSLDLIKHYRESNCNQSSVHNEIPETPNDYPELCKFVQDSVGDECFEGILDIIKQMDVPRVIEPLQCDLLLKEDPVLSFVAEVSKHNEPAMDAISTLILDRLKGFSNERKTTLMLVLSALYCKSYQLNLPVHSMIQTLFLKPSHLAARGGNEVKMRADERLNVGGETIEIADLDTVKPGKWINDKIINAYLSQLKTDNNCGETHVFVFPSYTAALWENGNLDHWIFKKVKMLLFKTLILPVNINNIHWVLIAADVKKRTVSVLDSMNGQHGEKYVALWRRFFEIRDDALEEKLGKWQYLPVVSNQQEDGNSCGVYTLMNAECIIKGVPHQIMRQIHCNTYRQHVQETLIHHGRLRNGSACDMPGCHSSDKGHQRWIKCDVCGRWLHTRCCGISTKAAITTEDFICIVCRATYN